MSNIPLTNETQHQRFEHLMRANRRKVYQLARTLTKTQTDAEDLVQDTFIRAYQGFKSYDERFSFLNWVYKITLRLHLDRKRAADRRVRTTSYQNTLHLDMENTADGFEEILHPTNQTHPEQAFLSNLLGPDWEFALQSLTHNQRMVVRMVDLEGVEYEDLSTKTGISVGTLRSLRHRAHQKIRGALDSYDTPSRIP